MKYKTEIVIVIFIVILLIICMNITDPSKNKKLPKNIQHTDLDEDQQIMLFIDENKKSINNDKKSENENVKVDTNENTGIIKRVYLSF